MKYFYNGEWHDIATGGSAAAPYTQQQLIKHDDGTYTFSGYCIGFHMTTGVDGAGDSMIAFYPLTNPLTTLEYDDDDAAIFEVLEDLRCYNFLMGAMNLKTKLERMSGWDTGVLIPKAEVSVSEFSAAQLPKTSPLARQGLVVTFMNGTPQNPKYFKSIDFYGDLLEAQLFLVYVDNLKFRYSGSWND